VIAAIVENQNYHDFADQRTLFGSARAVLASRVIFDPNQSLVGKSDGYAR
jgi:hypothetical protein